MGEDKILLGIDMSTASRMLIELLIEDAFDPAIFAEVAKANMQRPDILAFLLEHPDTPDEVRQQISSSLSVPAKAKSEIIRFHKTPEEHAQTILQRIQKLSVSERILLALRGGMEIRSILLRDPNKEVSLTVLENPKITDKEVEMIARSRSVSDEALRRITKKREWMKNYGIINALVTNPKTPPGVALPLVSDLKTRDLVLLEKNKNVSEGIRATAKKLARARKGL
jgi:pentose-5-phosphate-3-epimerase